MSVLLDSHVDPFTEDTIPDISHRVLQLHVCVIGLTREHFTENTVPDISHTVYMAVLFDLHVHGIT